MKGAGLQAHHLIEKRFAGLFGQRASQMLSIAVTPTEQQVFTNAWRAAFPYGAGTLAATPAAVLREALRIYANHPETLRALNL